MLNDSVLESIRCLISFIYIHTYVYIKYIQIHEKLFYKKLKGKLSRISSVSVATVGHA